MAQNSSRKKIVSDEVAGAERRMDRRAGVKEGEKPGAKDVENNVLTSKRERNAVFFFFVHQHFLCLLRMLDSTHQPYSIVNCKS